MYKKTFKKLLYVKIFIHKKVHLHVVALKGKGCYSDKNLAK